MVYKGHPDLGRFTTKEGSIHLETGRMRRVIYLCEVGQNKKMPYVRLAHGDIVSEQLVENLISLKLLTIVLRDLGVLS